MNQLFFCDLQPTLIDFRHEVLKGLSLPQKAFPPQFFFHDKYGSDLFTKICKLEEYYITRTEIDILQQNSQEIADVIGKNALLIEYGSGSIEKVHPLIETLESPIAYVPIDIAKEHLFSYAEFTSSKYPQLNIIAVAADYTQEFQLPMDKMPPGEQMKNKVILFAGSTLGNLERSQAIALLQKSAQLLEGQGGMLIGVDLKKDPTLLHAAYNDSQGLTAQFNLNILTNINRELQGNFDIDQFYHHAPYNPVLGRIELHLISKTSQVVTVAGQEFTFREGESIHSENSHKYSIEDLQELSEAAGFKLKQTWTDSQKLFSVNYLDLVS
ncbi:L-histidine N(alpha)-methyltransferase [Roseofilum sp. BLCC_M91]|uniref:L-histidine N(Alpha)-methyltransferase n=1 Tax=Roseofilum halophilum BLCC-M91 TaxID=3022259 RepID=A0ABT7BFY0_9CYAN|nr:L-histidine N(alpha)-methyltransferase [Roseofilum halophilum]MDJ1177499.1 L-histidine N(alpha)-methyltransferase [Roseofilum halophilum BLCC-M91]